MSSQSRTVRWRLSCHLWSAALLASATLAALAADRLASPPSATNADRALEGVRAYLTPVDADLGAVRSEVQPSRDPFESEAAVGVPAVAPAVPTPTVNATRRPARQLTAILIADDRPIAVIDGEVVNVGDVLPDGAKVASIREDRVSLLERGGQWRVLTLPGGRP